MFSPCDGDVADVSATVEASSVHSSTEEITKGISCTCQRVEIIGTYGDFYLQYEEQITSLISIRDSDLSLKTIIMKMQLFEDLQVSKTTVSELHRFWDITFTHTPGNLSLFKVHNMSTFTITEVSGRVIPLSNGM
jgi:hypothetical protein